MHLDIFLAGAGEGHCHKNPIVTIIVGNYPLSYYGTSAVNVYPLQNDPPPFPLGLPTGVSSCHRLSGGSHLAHMESNNGICNTPLCPSLPISFRQRKHVKVILPPPPCASTARCVTLLNIFPALYFLIFLFVLFGSKYFSSFS